MLRLEPRFHSLLSKHHRAEDELLGRCFQGPMAEKRHAREQEQGESVFRM